MNKLIFSAAVGFILTTVACVSQNSQVADREPASEINVAGGLIKNGLLKASGPVAEFKLPSTLRVLPQPMKQGPMTFAGMAKNEIAITIDDGPSAENNAVVLKILKDHGVTAMFFLVGKEVEKHPELVKNILRAGHPVGIHTWSHPNMPTLPIKAAEEQIDKTYTLLKSIAKELSKEEKKDDAHAYRIQPFFRFPYGAGASALNMQKLLADRNLANFHWSMTTKDSETEDGDVALNTAVGMLTRYGHGVFLMHETHIAGVRSLPYFLQQLKDRNYQTIYFEAAPEAH